jgi:hypothetical protein
MPSILPQRRTDPAARQPGRRIDPAARQSGRRTDPAASSRARNCGLILNASPVV